MAVEHPNKDAERDGLSRSVLIVDVELRLRQAGITVLSADSDDAPILYVAVTAVRSRYEPVYAYFVEIDLRQVVVLGRNVSFSTYAATWWATATVATVGAARFPDSVRGSIRNQVDEFINAYLAVNPKR